MVVKLSVFLLLRASQGPDSMRMDRGETHVKGRRYWLSTTELQAVCLLCFNDNDSLSVSQIANQIGLSELLWVTVQGILPIFNA